MSLPLSHRGSGGISRRLPPFFSLQFAPAQQSPKRTLYLALWRRNAIEARDRQASGEPDMDMQTPDLESLVSQDYDRCHPGDSFADLKRRARFTKEDKGLLADWLSLAALRHEEATTQSEGR